MKIPLIYLIIKRKMEEKIGKEFDLKDIRSFFSKPLGIDKRMCLHIIKDMEEYEILDISRNKIELNSF